MFKRVGFLLIGCVIFLAPQRVLAETLRDPTTPLGHVRTAPKFQRLTLQAIYRGSGRREAIVNGNLVKEGELLNGAKIVSIHEKSVTYRREGTTQTIYLRPNVVKRSP